MIIQIPIEYMIILEKYIRLMSDIDGIVRKTLKDGT